MISKLGLVLGAITTVFISSLSFAGATKENVVRWPYGVVPYEINQASNTDSLAFRKQMWENAVEYWNNQTDLTFVDISGMSPAERSQYPVFVELTYWLAGCQAPLGYFDAANVAKQRPFFGDKGSAKYPADGSQQRITAKLWENCTTEMRDGDVAIPEAYFANGAGGVHELGHVVGLIHEHQRSDRDNHIFVHSDRIGALNHLEWSVARSSIQLSEYDYLSAMHYYPHQGNGLLNDLEPEGLVLSFDPVDPSDASQLAKSDKLKAEFPNFVERLNTRTGLSATDVQTANYLYRRDLADVIADSLVQLSYCNQADYNEGKCAQQNLLTLKSAAANLGPWDASSVTITHILHPELKLDNVDHYSSDADRCDLDSVSYCTAAACAEDDAYTRLAMCAAKDSSDCSNVPALVCVSESLTPMQVINTELTFQHPNVGKYDYAIVVSAAGEDDMTFNNSVSKTMAQERACGCSGCPESSTGGVDPTLPASAAFAYIMLLFGKRRSIFKS